MLLRNVLRSTLAATLVIGTCNLAIAQYGGGGGMGGTGGGMPGSPTYNPHRGYSNKGTIVGGVAAGAAAVGGLIYWKHHHQSKLVGCVNGNGDKLTSDKDHQTYSLSNAQDETLKPGDRVELMGKKLKSDSSEPTFEVLKMNKDLGMCTTTSARAR